MKKAMPKCQPVAITGMGIVSSTGEGIPAFTDALFHGRSYFSHLLIRRFHFQ